MSVLDELVAGALEDQRTRELTVSLEDVKKAALAAPAPIDATRWLKRADGIPVIAEIKRASPSKGHLSDIPDPAALAREYEKGGASAISVLTEGRRFLGSLDDFDKVRAAVHIPVLRKDFIVTDYQIFEARAHGADLVLLIVAALDDARLKRLLDLAHELGMTVLVETHTREEIERARKAGAKVIGINARNLKNLKVDVNKYNELAADLPDDVIKVAESGVFGAVEVEDYARAGADAVLVGEGVATADNHELAVERLVKAGAQVKASETTPLSEHQGPYWSQFGGRYVPEALITALDELERVYNEAKADPEFHKEFMTLQQRYVGRPSPLTEAPRFSALVKEKTGLDARIFLKREDLNHTGAHKINNALGQALLVKRMGKTRVIAETGAGQHGTATAMVCALLGLDCTIYMGATDVVRQAPNVERMELMGATVVPVDSGAGTLKDAVNEALRDWTASFADTHYLLGTAAGPHPFPTIVREYHRVISREARAQVLGLTGRLPDSVIACVGGGSNAIGMFAEFIDDPGVELIGVEPAGEGLDTSRHGAPINKGLVGILHGARSYLMRTSEGQVEESFSVSAGLDYPGVGPEHAWLSDTGRARYVGISDDEAIEAFRLLSRHEGIIPAVESAHALAQALAMARQVPDGEEPPILLVCLSGRGDKDLDQVQARLGGSFSTDGAVARASRMVEQMGKRTEYAGLNAARGTSPDAGPDEEF